MSYESPELSAESVMTPSFEFHVPAFSSHFIELVTKRELGTVRFTRVSRVPPSKSTTLRHMFLPEDTVDALCLASLPAPHRRRKQVH